MPKMCEVPFCKEIGAHNFPKDPNMVKMWLKAIRRKNFRPQKNSKLCRKHFHDSDFQNISIYTGLQNQHRYLKKTAIPSIFPWSNKTLSAEAQQREQRLINRNIRKNLFEVHQTAVTTDSTECSSGLSGQEYNIIESLHSECDDICIEVEATEEIETTDNFSEIESGTTYSSTYRSLGTQTSVSLRIFCTDLLESDDSLVMFYTGLENYSKFILVLNTLLPMANNLKYRWSKVAGVSIEDQFLMLLIKLRRNKPDIEIGTMFNISKTEVSNIIVTWIHFVHDMWSLIDIWPERDLVNYYMPKLFKKENSSTRIIIDATEIPINKPSNHLSQRATYSSYKNKNTIKFLVGSTPGGLFCYCSQGYGGATSDRQMIERSPLIDKCQEGDCIMADRGFNVQDLFAIKNISINIPTFLKGKSQIPGVLLKRDQKLARQRVHIERLIGLTKTYKILQTPLNSFYVPLASEIFFICFMLCNFRECIVDNKK